MDLSGEKAQRGLNCKREERDEEGKNEVKVYNFNEKIQVEGVVPGASFVEIALRAQAA